MSKQRKTNVQQLVKMMNFSEFGALKQVFIISAIENYSAAVLTSPDEKFGSSLISHEAWKGCASECLNELEAHYASEAP